MRMLESNGIITTVESSMYRLIAYQVHLKTEKGNQYTGQMKKS